MTSFAYIAFTIAACVLGLGVGLLVHFLRGLLPFGKIASATEDASTLDLTGVVTTAQKPWETISDWQRDSNRSFAFHLGTCGASPAVVAIVAWSSRSDVVHSICTGMQQIAVSSPLCF
jgi:hypothetical protein